MTDDQRPDSELLTRLRNEPALIGVLYERHAQAVFRYLARRTGEGTAEDLVSDVFVAALAGRKRVVAHASDSALPWLYGIARNVLQNHLRRRRASLPREARADAVDWDAVDSRIDAEAQRSELRTALANLSRSERELLLLVAWEGLSPTEAAEALGISKIAARSRLHRARQRALDALRPDDSNDLIASLLTNEENPT